MESKFLNDIQKAPFLFLNDHPWDYFSPISKVIDNSQVNNICDDETFYTTFMSELNIQYLNMIIKKTVYNNNCNNYIITDQKKEHMIQIMKGIYNDNAQHLNFDQKKQFNILNKLVIDYCVDTILKELNIRYKYFKDKFGPLELLPPPISTSIAGSKSFLPKISSKYKIEDIYKNNKSNLEIIDNINETSYKKIYNNNENEYGNILLTNDRNNMFLDNKNITDKNIKTDYYYQPRTTPGIFDDDIFSSHQIIKK